MSCSYIATGHTIHSIRLVFLRYFSSGCCCCFFFSSFLLFLLLFLNWLVACVHSYEWVSVEMADDDDDDDAGHARGHRFLSSIVLCALFCISFITFFS